MIISKGISAELAVAQKLCRNESSNQKCLSKFEQKY